MRGKWFVVGAVCGALCLAGCADDSITGGTEKESASPTESSSGPVGANSGPDYAKNVAANRRAAEVASQFVPAIEKDSSYGGVTIVASGLRVAVAGTPSPEVAEAVAGMRKTVPVTVWSVEHSLSELKALTDRIDGDPWAEKGINLSSWGPDEETNVVVITLTKYSPQAAKQLADAYGSDWIRVSKRSETNTAADGSGAGVG